MRNNFDMAVSSLNYINNRLAKNKHNDISMYNDVINEVIMLLKDSCVITVAEALRLNELYLYKRSN